MATKHSYMDDSEKAPDPAPVEKGPSEKDQKRVEGTDPGVKKGYNEKNPTQPQGSFTADSNDDKSVGDQDDDESSDTRR